MAWRRERHGEAVGERCTGRFAVCLGNDSQPCFINSHLSLDLIRLIKNNKKKMTHSQKAACPCFEHRYSRIVFSPSSFAYSAKRRRIFFVGG